MGGGRCRPALPPSSQDEADRHEGRPKVCARRLRDVAALLDVSGPSCLQQSRLPGTLPISGQRGCRGMAGRRSRCGGDQAECGRSLAGLRTSCPTRNEILAGDFDGKCGRRRKPVGKTEGFFRARAADNPEGKRLGSVAAAGDEDATMLSGSRQSQEFRGVDRSRRGRRPGVCPVEIPNAVRRGTRLRRHDRSLVRSRRNRDQQGRQIESPRLHRRFLT